MTAVIHGFRVDLAAKYGVDEAILISHFALWIAVNKRRGRNLHDDRTWMYQTLEEIADSFPYWNRDSVRRIVNNLVAAGVIRRGNYNKSRFDKTVWYAFENESEFIPDFQEILTKGRTRPITKVDPPDPKSRAARPIPDSITDSETDIRKQTAPERGHVSEIPTRSAHEEEKKERFGEHCLLKPSQYESLCSQHGKGAADKKIEEFNLWWPNAKAGTKRNCDYSRLKSWFKRPTSNDREGGSYRGTSRTTPYFSRNEDGSIMKSPLDDL